jgi:tetratricopeptide (TPR) repeat protein
MRRSRDREGKGDMHETVRDSDSVHNLPPEEASLPLAPSASPSSLPRSHRLAGFLRSILAIPLAFVRNPWRSSAIAVLLLFIAAGSGIAGVWLWASYHLRAGRSALEHYHNAEAVTHLKAVLTVWPHDPETLLLAARAARRAGSFDDADRLLDRCQEVQPDNDSLVLERICLRAERGETDSVEKYCQALIERNDPASPLVFEALAKGYLRGYQLQKAQTLLQEWLEHEKDNPQALLIQGQLEDLKLRYADAVKSYRAALTVDATLDEARLRLCDDLMALGSFEEARPHLEYLNRRFPDNFKVQVYRARLEDRLGHADEAERILDAVLARQPRFAPALVERGILALRGGQLVEAENYLRQAIQENPGDLQAHHQLALCLERNGKPAEADQEQEQDKQIEQDMKAIQALVIGKLERDPHNADLHYQIGAIALRAGANEEALRWLHSALKEDPHHQLAHEALREYYQRIGALGQAHEHSQQSPHPQPLSP